MTHADPDIFHPPTAEVITVSVNENVQYYLKAIGVLRALRRVFNASDTSARFDHRRRTTGNTGYVIAVRRLLRHVDKDDDHLVVGVTAYGAPTRARIPSKPPDMTEK